MLSVDGENAGLVPGSQKNALSVGLDFEDITSQLPSKGKHYNEGARVYIRPYYFNEVKGMTRDWEMNNNIIDIYEKATLGIVTKNMEVSDIILGDFLFASFLRKVKTLGGTAFNVIVTINDIPYSGQLNVSDIGFKESPVTKFPVIGTLGGDSKEIEFYPVTIGQYVEYVKEHDGENLDELDELKISSRHVADDVIDRLYSPEDQEVCTQIRELIDFGVTPIEANLKNTLNQKEERLEYYPDSLDALIFPVTDTVKRNSVNKVSFV